MAWKREIVVPWCHGWWGSLAGKYQTVITIFAIISTYQVNMENPNLLFRSFIPPCIFFGLLNLFCFSVLVLFLLNYVANRVILDWISLFFGGGSSAWPIDFWNSTSIFPWIIFFGCKSSTSISSPLYLWTQF